MFVLKRDVKLQLTRCSNVSYGGEGAELHCNHKHDRDSHINRSTCEHNSPQLGQSHPSRLSPPLPPPWAPDPAPDDDDVLVGSRGSLPDP